MLKIYFLFFLFLSSYSVLADNNNLSLWHKIKQRLSDTWHSDNYELYVPVNTWHNRATYDSENIKGYNERPWGIGMGVYRFDQDGDWHALYVMEFQDSHNVIEPIGGYAYQTYWRPSNSDKFRIGIGYTLSITARKDYNWIPFPAPLPLLSFEYDRLSIQSTYIPGVKRNTGNIIFTWLKLELGSLT
ncbi:lipid IV(A) palmitoyltransferase PagP [Orbus hercynius]|nr:lipid IV(A) palmitoyltransferase PagP [Orbus hercynius]